MNDTHAGGTAGILEDALALAGAGRLDNAVRARLWALVAEAVIAGGTAHALVEIDVQARGRAGKPGNDGSAASKAAKREGDPAGLGQFRALVDPRPHRPAARHLGGVRHADRAGGLPGR